MSQPFVRTAAGIEVHIKDLEIAVLRLIPRLLDDVGEPGVDPAATRLAPDVHPDDAARSEEFRRLSREMIEDGRQEDRDIFAACLDAVEAGEPLSPEDAEAWMRAIGEARLILGARLGIDDDGWETDRTAARSDPRIGVLHLLGHLQDALVGVLMSGL